jgi:2'-5' RNA ligase
MRDDLDVADLASQARARLAPFSAGLHFTPDKWVHMPTLVAGPADRFSEQQLQHMAKIAADRLADTPPIPVSRGKILYHPEAIMLAVTPADAPSPFRTAALAATQIVTEQDHDQDESWTPHVTLAYSTAGQQAKPIIGALCTRLPEREIHIRQVCLVIQNGPEREWNWTTICTVPLIPQILA